MVYKTCNLVDVIRELDDCGFGVNKLQFIHDENKDFSTCFLVEAEKNKKHNTKVVSPVVITH